MKFIVLTLFVALTYAKIEYRLPQSVIPKNYKLNILTHLGPEETNFKFIGDVNIEVVCIHSTTNVTLHSKELQIQKNTIEVHDTSKDAKKLDIIGFDYNKITDFFIIKLKEALQQDHKYIILIKFMGELTDNMAGFYRSSYVDQETKERRWLAVTQFEATNARKAFPCFDEPAMKATYEISLGRHKNYTTLSNMPLESTEAAQGKEGWFWDHYKKSVKMSTYVVAFLVFDYAFKQAEQTENGVVFKIWARKNAINQVDFAKETGSKSLTYFEKYFGIKYPIPKQDMVAIPDFRFTGMENWGLITYRETAILYDPNLSNTNDLLSISSTISHELAHQWFGNLVTMKWWTDIWLNEGFATYMAALGVQHLFPQWNLIQEEAADNLLSVYVFDGLKNSHPISAPVENPIEIFQKFDAITYLKGSSIIRMMGEFLGELTLQKGVSNYLKKHQYNNADQDDLWQSLTEQAHSDGALSKKLTVKAIMDTWTLQTGYPVVTVERNYDDHSAEISQERFFHNPAQLPEGETCWWVPLTYTSKSESNFTSTRPKEWLRCPKQKQTIRNLPGDDEWVIFNIGMSGLYRVNYDKNNWNFLIETLTSSSYNTIPVLNRVQLIDDAADLALAGRFKYETLFKLLEYVKREDEYLPWRTVLSNTGNLDKVLRRTGIYGEFKSYMKKLMIPIYEKVGGLSTISFQTLITAHACVYGVEQCKNKAVELFKKYRQNPESQDIIPKEMRKTVYCEGIGEGNESDWNFLWQQYQKSDVAEEKSDILVALGCTKEIWLLKRYLDWSLDKPNVIGKQDAWTVFAAVANSEVGSYIALDFIFDNFYLILLRLTYNIGSLWGYLYAVVGVITTERELNGLKAFIESEENIPMFAQIKQEVDKAVEMIKIRVDWRENNEKDVTSILANYEKEQDYSETCVYFPDTTL